MASCLQCTLQSLAYTNQLQVVMTLDRIETYCILFEKNCFRSFNCRTELIFQHEKLHDCPLWQQKNKGMLSP